MKNSTIPQIAFLFLLAHMATGGEFDQIEALRSDRAQTRVAAFNGLVEARKKRIERLVRVAADVELRTSNPEAVHDAIRLLGEYRAVEAVDTLCSLLFFKPREDEDRILLPTKDFPALGALVRIGRPSIEPLLDRLDDEIRSHEGNQQEAPQLAFRGKLIAFAIMGIEGGRESAIPTVRARVSQYDADRQDRIKRSVFWLFLTKSYAADEKHTE